MTAAHKNLHKIQVHALLSLLSLSTILLQQVGNQKLIEIPIVGTQSSSLNCEPNVFHCPMPISLHLKKIRGAISAKLSKPSRACKDIYPLHFLPRVCPRLDQYLNSPATSSIARLYKKILGARCSPSAKSLLQLQDSPFRLLYQD